ncbi:CD63 antigen-like [Sesbania bispinosa]|nr:CD63 antigen-like [Sesbania bispinosa]
MNKLRLMGSQRSERSWSCAAMDGGGDWDREVWWLTGDACSDTAAVTVEPGCISSR